MADDRRSPDGDLSHFLCECFDTECRAYLPLDHSGYLQARQEHEAAGPNGAIVLPGHEHPSDRVLRDAAAYVLVIGRPPREGFRGTNLVRHPWFDQPSRPIGRTFPPPEAE